MRRKFITVFVAAIAFGCRIYAPAQTLGLSLSPILLAQVDEVIE